MVPIFAMLFGVINTRVMWAFEFFFYSKNSSDSYLFKHFDSLKLEGVIATSYKGHPFFAGISLLLSYYLLYTMNARTDMESVFFSSSYIISSSLMAWWGSKLVPTMYGNASAKEWTLFQSQLVILYNIVFVISLLTRSRKYQNFIVIMSFSLLVCAGIMERAYVLFVLPLFNIPGDAAPSSQRLYRKWYSIQFEVATLSSLVVASILVSQYKEQLLG